MTISDLLTANTSWKQITHSLSKLDRKQKGELFERLVKLYFKLSPEYMSLYDSIWLWSEVPETIKQKLSLPNQDLGIDLLCAKKDEFHAIQCKYIQDESESLTGQRVSTFLSIYNKTPEIRFGYICTTTDVHSRNLKKYTDGSIQLVKADTWRKRINEEFILQAISYLKGKKRKLVPFRPFDHQKSAINNAHKHFKIDGNTRGKLIFPCGSGKSLTGYWICDELKSKRTIVALPSLALVKQTLEVYLREVVANKKSIKWLCICSDEGIGKSDDIFTLTQDIGVPCVTDVEYIEKWLLGNIDEDIMVFTTYQSGRIISDISKKLGLEFNLGIFDEAHKTVGKADKLFSHLLFDENIVIQHRVFMTATERFYSGSKDDILSMDDVDVYGKTFSYLSFKEAINNNPPLLTDYKVITIEVSNSEVKDFIKDNNLIELNSVWSRETEARSLASLLALRKAMRKYPINNAVSFHSTIKKAQRGKEIQSILTQQFELDPIESFTISGKDSASRRSKIIDEFARSDKAIITNAKCLTEGVDVPKIDCIVFSDPKKSKVDIVQALGRALRIKEGKEWGYVILPLVFNEETKSIDNKSFNDILSIVRSLAANDERIIEYLRDKNEKEASNSTENQFHLEIITDRLDANELEEHLEIKLWDKLARLNWRSYHEAKAFARSLGLSSNKEWREYVKSEERPLDIPVNPDQVYSKEGQWESWSEWLGTQNLGKLDTSIFINRAKTIHKGKYDYSLVKYSNNRTKVKIICPKHGVFEQAPYVHMHPRGCPKCSKKYVSWSTDSLKEAGFESKAREIHGSKYDYSKVDYINNSTKVMIICPKHGLFNQTPQAHLKGQGCRKCYDELKKKDRLESFITKAQKTHNNKYDYSEVEYVNKETPVKIICPDHGAFKQRPGNHLAGNGCSICSGIKSNKKNFIKKARKKHGDKFDYTKTVYTRLRDKIVVTCKKHGDFTVGASNHLLKWGGCPKCKKELIRERRGAGKNHFIERARKVHGDKYDYSKVDYQTNKIKVEIICPRHGSFFQKPTNHYQGTGCPGCAK
jgi:superfamily II DNA or RNA helicase